MKNNHDNWSTPKDFYARLDAIYRFDFDPCPLHATFDGLDPSVPWGQRNFVNPPYSRGPKQKFIERAIREARAGALCCLLLPVDTSTKFFHDVILPENPAIYFVRGRIAFGDGSGTQTKKQGARFSSMVVIFGGEDRDGPLWGVL